MISENCVTVYSVLCVCDLTWGLNCAIVYNILCVCDITDIISSVINCAIVCTMQYIMSICY